MPPTRRVEFIAWGNPTPKGSVKAFKAQNSGQIIVSHGNLSKTWEATIAAAAAEVMVGDLMTGPISFYAIFTMPKGRTVKRDLPATKQNDLDKLLRPVWDALTDVVWEDDGYVCEEYGKKVYVGDEARGALPRPGVRVVLETMS